MVVVVIGFIAAFSLRFGVCNGFKVEVPAVAEGLELARLVVLENLLVQEITLHVCKFLVRRAIKEVAVC